ncbi:MAG: hypothetical protein JWN13_6875 [Betaproteobacteria bacterium]|jgi:hypothetical protein|nr:hypothetical protein [Betaproteobacteria bacterium]
MRQAVPNVNPNVKPLGPYEFMCLLLGMVFVIPIAMHVVGYFVA